MERLGRFSRSWRPAHQIQRASRDSRGRTRHEEIATFFFSLLWRAAASERYEFKEIVLPNSDLEILRKTLLGQEEPDLAFFPVQLTQISTKGLMHNQTPYTDVKFIHNLDNADAEPYVMPTIRFYFDGLVAHYAVQLPPSHSAPDLGNIIVGAAPKVVLSTVTFEDSMQGREMLTVLRHYHPEGN